MNAEQLTIFILLPAAGYLLGSIPFAWVIGKIKGVDIRAVGSKNIGATNLGRTLGKRYFWQAFLLDAAKGFLPVLIATLLVRYWQMQQDIGSAIAHEALSSLTKLFGVTDNPPDSQRVLPLWSPLLTGTAAVLGHLFPLYLKFKGGKGVATGFGVVLGFWPLYTLSGILAGAFFVFMLLIYRYISLASMSAALVFAILVTALGSWPNRWLDTYVPPHDRGPLIVVAFLFAAMIIFRHRANITRLLKGTEPKIGQREIDKARMDK